MDERDRQFIRYCLADPLIAQLWIDLRRVAERQLAELERALDRYRSHRSDFERISVRELLEGMSRNEILLIDARPEVEFQIVHAAITKSPTDEWSAQQLREATPWGKCPKYLLHDRDCKYASLFSAVAAGSDIKELRTPYRAPMGVARTTALRDLFSLEIIVR